MSRPFLLVCCVATPCLFCNQQGDRFPIAEDLPAVIRYCQKSIAPEDRFTGGLSSSIVAAWQVTVKNSPEGERLRATRFLGFLEGRLRANVPTWWEAYLSGGVRSKHGVGFAHVDDKRWISRAGIALSGFEEATLRGGALTLAKAGRTWVFAAELFEELRDLPKDLQGGDPAIYIVGGSSGRDLVVGFQSSGFLDGPQRLYCIRDGKVRWTARSPIGLRPGGYSGGYWGTYSQIIICRQRVYIFGAHDEALFINGFELASGKHEVRFATSFVK